MQRIVQFLLLLFILVSVPGIAADTPFDPGQANKTLDQLNIKLSTEQLNVAHLQDAVEVLSKLRDQADACVKETKSEIEKVDEQLKIAVSTEATDEQKYLQTKKSELEKRSSNCRLFVLRSKEVITAFSETIQAHVATRLLERKAPIWKNIIESPDFLQVLYRTFDTQKFIDRSGFLIINKYLLIAVGAIFLLSILIGLKVSSFLHRHLNAEPSEESGEIINQSLIATTINYLPAFLPLALVCLFIEIYTFMLNGSTYIGDFCQTVLVYILYIFLVRFIFYPPLHVRSVSGMPRKLGKHFFHQMQLLGLFGLISYMIYVIWSDQVVSDSIAQIASTSFMTVLSFNLYAVIGAINKLPTLRYKHRLLHFSVVTLLVGVVALILTSEFIGYHNLALYVLSGLAMTFGLTILALSLSKIIGVAVDSLLSSKKPWQQRFHEFLNLPPHGGLPELFILKIVAYSMVIVVWTFLVLRAWGLSEADALALVESVTDGFTLGGIEIIPVRIAYALLFLCGFLILTRLVRSYCLYFSRFGRTRGAREAVATLIGYVGFAISTVVALLIAGVNFTGIAIIAGALSVGIGFGLQGIVNNFVSGLILLIERPIRIGDRIDINGQEGYVRDVSIRATTISTLARTDIIVPNADIISSQVTNMMFKDQNFRIEIKVGVAYGSDTELVKKTLLQVAKEHPDVITDDDRYKPRVLFRAFGGSSLNFELWCIIGNVNLRNTVESDLYFMVDKAFRDQHIVIAFPQQDVHLKEWPTGKKLEYGEVE